MPARGYASPRQAERAVLLLCAGAAAGLLLLPDAAQVRVADALGAFTLEPIQRLRAFVADVGRVREENAQLQARIAALELERVEAARIRRDADRQRAAARLEVAGLGALQPCEVVARRAGRLPSLIKIRSPRPLVWVPYQPVLAPTGLLGRVRQPVGSYEAWVELMTSPDLALGCELERTGILGILRSRDGEFTLEMVGRAEDVVPGDRVLTSGIAEIRDGGPGGAGPAAFPRGLPVGVVAGVETPAEQIFKRIRVEPLAPFTHGDVVFVVTKPGAWYLPALTTLPEDTARARPDSLAAAADSAAAPPGREAPFTAPAAAPVVAPTAGEGAR